MKPFLHSLTLNNIQSLTPQTGLELDLIQEYILIPLEIFLKKQHNKNKKITDKLDANTVQLMVEEQQQLIEKQKEQIRQLDMTISKKLAEIDNAVIEKNNAIAEKDSAIADFDMLPLFYIVSYSVTSQASASTIRR